MNFSYDGAYTMPGQQAAVETYENEFWFGGRHQQLWTGMILSGASRDTGNTSYTTVLRTGLLMGMVTSTKKVKEWNPTGTDSSENIIGVLHLGINTQRLGANDDKWLAYLMVGGTVKADRLLIPGSTTLGIASATQEHNIRAQMHRRFLFSDKWEGNPFGGWRNMVFSGTANSATVTAADNNVIFSNRGADSIVTYTLPATPYLGLHYGFYVADADGLTVAAGTGDTMLVNGDATADSISSTTIGTFIEVFGDGTGWMTHVSPVNAALSANVPAALTVADGAGTNDGTIGAITADASVIAAVQELAAMVNKITAAIGVTTYATA